MRIDTHQEFWHRDSTACPVSDNPTLNQDYLPAHVEYCLQENGFHGCLAVQSVNDAQENQRLIELHKQFDYIKGVIGCFDQSSDASHLTDAIIGVRVEWPKLADVISKIDPRMAIDVIASERHEKELAALADQYSNQHFVLNDLGISSSGFEEWAQDLESFRDIDNVFCKLSGLLTQVQVDPMTEELIYDDLEPFLDHAFSVFGAQRLMFASAWPHCLLTSTFDELYDVIQAYMERLTIEDQEAVMGGTASRCYRLA